MGKGVDLGPAAGRGVGLGYIGRCLFVFMLAQLCCALVIMKDHRSDAVSEKTFINNSKHADRSLIARVASRRQCMTTIAIYASRRDAYVSTRVHRICRFRVTLGDCRLLQRTIAIITSISASCRDAVYYYNM